MMENSAIWPELSFPPAEADFLRQEYERASVILEYGSGGSTILASEMPGKRVFSVESDRAWAMRMQARIDELAPASPASIHYFDIGPTGEWGRPLGKENWPLFFRYPIDIWEKTYFRHPDVILIDGRFRPACLAAAGMMCQRPVRVLFDDYAERPLYHVIEQIFHRGDMIGRMAVFDVVPGQVSLQDFPRIMRFFAHITYHGQPDPYKHPHDTIQE